MVLPLGIAVTPEAITAIISGDLDLKPVLQVLEVCRIGASHTAQERFRMEISDGKHAQRAILATQLNKFVKTGQVKKGSLVQLQEYICNTIQNKKVVIVLNMSVVLTDAEIIADIKHVSSTVAEPQESLDLPSNPAMGRADLHTGKEDYNFDGSVSRAFQAQRPLDLDANVGGSSEESNRRSADISQLNQSCRSTEGQLASTYSSKGPISKNEAPAKIVPIAALNPYQGRWTIKARVTAKGELRRFHNARGDGKVFHFDLLDADGGEIRATCFNSVADQFYDRIEVGKVYLLSKGSLKASQRSFNHLKNDWEIFLENSSKVEPCFEGDTIIPQQQFDFKAIGTIENMEANAMVDVIGVVVSVGSTNTIVRKNGMETQKRTLQLRDVSGKSVEVTMWGAFCSREGQELQYLCGSGQYPVLALKAGRVSDFSGKSVGTISTTQLFINPEFAAACTLRVWFEKEGRTMASQSISKEAGATRIEMRKTVGQIKDEGLGMSNKPDWIAIKATILCIKTENFCYTACPMPLEDRQCNKKVSRNSDGTWKCDRCDRCFPECDYRYLLSIQAQDDSGVSWITAFQEAGEELMGVSAKALYMWKEDDDPRFGEAIQRLLFTQRLLNLKVREENFNEERQVKCTLIKSEKLNYTLESRLLVELIHKTLTSRIPQSDVSSSGRTNLGSEMHVGGPSKYGLPGHGGSSMVSAFGMIGPAHGYNADDFSSGNGSDYGDGSRISTSNCFKCGKGGHWARDCPNQSNLGYGLTSGGGSRGGYRRRSSGF